MPTPPPVPTPTPTPAPTPTTPPVYTVEPGGSGGTAPASGGDAAPRPLPDFSKYKILSGTAGSDNLNGGTANEVISGGKGNDFLTGRGGEDVFKIAASDIDASNRGYDKIFDFEGAGRAGGDMLRLEGFGAGSTLSLATDTYKQGTYLDGSNQSVFVYRLYDTTSNSFELIHLTSKSGLALSTDDYLFG